MKNILWPTNTGFMKGTYLGEFEEIVMLAVAILHGQAYAVGIMKEIEKQSGRSVHISAVHTALYRLEEKGFLQSQLGEATQTRGGKRKRLFTVTAYGARALQEAMQLRQQMWTQVPKVVWQGG
jgi:PadR family transcriptional regulator, regulatory protein PadR